jgi:alkaline phosphatase D
MKVKIITLLMVFLGYHCLTANAQDKRLVISGPMLGQVELRTASIWIESDPAVIPDLKYWKKGATDKIKYIHARAFPEAVQQGFNPLLFSIGGLEPRITYEYQVTKNLL